jgi:hypothetical protein
MLGGVECGTLQSAPRGALCRWRGAGALAIALGDVALQGRASHNLGMIYYTSGAYGRAAELFRQNVQALKG